MKRIAGFITGLIIASILWFGFNHFATIDFNPSNKKEIKQTISKAVTSVTKVIDPVSSKKEEAEPGFEPVVAPIVEKDIKPDIESGITQITEVVTAENLAQKQYFWQPFDLLSKAEGFSKYISSNSSVVCVAERTAVGEFMTYFLYEDEQDRYDKISLIEKTGISLKLNQEEKNE